MPLPILVETSFMGNDRVFLIHGGRAHIGAAALAYPDGEQHRCESLSVPGHREAQLAAEMASYAARELKQTVTVVMGIHVDHASKKDIQQIIQSVRHEMRKEIMRLKA